MGDESLIGLLGSNDLGLFNQSIQQNDPYGLIGRSLASWQPDTSTWSAGESGATAFGKAFLSGLLQNYAQNRAADQLSSVVNVLPALKADPYTVQTPEGVDSNAFNLLRGSAVLKKAQREALYGEESKKSVADLMKTVLGEGLKSGTIEPGDAIKAAATGDYSNILNNKEKTSNPNDPREKKTVELRNAFEGKSEVKNFKYVERLSNQLVSTMKNPSAVADPILAKMVVQFVEPELAVNAGEAAGLAASTSIPESWKGMIGKALNGESVLTPEIRKGLLDIASSAYDAHGKSFEQTKNLYKSEADRFGIPFERITNLGVTSFGDLTGAKAGAPASIETFLSKAPPKSEADVKVALAAILKEMNDPKTPFARKQELKGLAYSLVPQPPRTAGGTPKG